LFIISQIIAVATDDVTDLWKASLALGLAYGGLFGLFPTIAIELFGIGRCQLLLPVLLQLTADAPLIAHFSENWGFLSLSSMLGGNIFSIAFGRNLDAHSTFGIEHPQLPLLNSTSSLLSSNLLHTARLTPNHTLNIRLAEASCLEGRDCYMASFYITIAACCLALALSVWVAWKDRQKHTVIALGAKMTEAVWENDEE
jgi:hypothetical protein